MSPVRRHGLVLALASLLFAAAGVCAAQEPGGGAARVYSDGELFRKAEEEIRSLGQPRTRHRIEVAQRAERRLRRILKLYPDTPLRGRVEESIARAREFMADHHLKVAGFYVDRAARTGAARGARSRLLKIVQDYPEFSRMDEVLFFLADVSLIDGNPAEAANYFWELVCQFPASPRAAEAFGKLNEIGIDASKGCDNSKVN